MEPKKSIETNGTKNMYSVVEQMNAGYEKFFDSKPKTSAVRSECYGNYYKTCGTPSNYNIPKVSSTGITAKEIKSECGDPQQLASDNGSSVTEQFFPPDRRDDKTKECQRISNGSGCCKYLVKKEK